MTAIEDIRAVRKTLMSHGFMMPGRHYILRVLLPIYIWHRRNGSSPLGSLTLSLNYALIEVNRYDLQSIHRPDTVNHCPHGVPNGLRCGSCLYRNAPKFILDACGGYVRYCLNRPHGCMRLELGTSGYCSLCEMNMEQMANETLNNGLVSPPDGWPVDCK